VKKREFITFYLGIDNYGRLHYVGLWWIWLRRF